jgi:hypothetical protein
MSNELSASVTLVVGALVLLSVPMILIVAFVASGRSHRRKLAEWRQLPTLDAYLAEHPECRTDDGPICHACREADLYQRGLTGITSSQRIHVCNACGAQLFRSGS